MFHSHPITDLVCSIFHRLELALHVRVLSFNNRDGDWYGRADTVPNIAVHKLALREAISFVHNTRLSYCKDWIEGLCQGSLDTWLAILLSHVPQL
jgi:hypothetical protein